MLGAGISQQGCTGSLCLSCDPTLLSSSSLLRVLWESITDSWEVPHFCCFWEVKRCCCLLPYSKQSSRRANLIWEVWLRKVTRGPGAQEGRISPVPSQCRCGCINFPHQLSAAECSCEQYSRMQTMSSMISSFSSLSSHLPPQLGNCSHLSPWDFCRSLK